MIIAIDPGIWEIGYCVGQHANALRACGVSRVPKTPTLGIAVAARGHAANIRTLAPSLGIERCDVYTESMTIRPTDGLAVSNDLLAVQSVGCMVAAELATQAQLGAIGLVPVQKWKGNIPKSIHHPRILDALTPAERVMVHKACVDAGKKNTKEVLDAVGLWLYCVGRIDNAGEKRHG